MKISILAAGYNCLEGLEDRLKPFQRPEFVISVVSAPFKDFSTDYKENESTVEFLTSLLRKNKIQWMYYCYNPLTEVETRNNALKPLLKDNCDYIWLLDLQDEYYKDKEIDNILKFIKEQQAFWYSVNFKNYVFNQDTWIDGFCPPRIFRVNCQGLKIEGFCEDNGVFYRDQYNQYVDFRTLSSYIIPRHKAFVKHFSWLSNENSKKKYEYQMKRWGLCSYKWNYELNKLEFNPEYYKDKPLPELNFE